MISYGIRPPRGGLLPRLDPRAAEASRVRHRHSGPRLQAFADRRGLLVQRFYREEPESGIKKDRKELCRGGTT